MFGGASVFDQDITGWTTSLVTDMSGMFFRARQFNQTLSMWDTSEVDTMQQMFDQASQFNQNLCGWKDNFPYGNALNIFRGSACKNKTTPVNDQGPFCSVSNCGLSDPV
eukprot:1059012-Ditylum_brightwellii.AAC.1